MSYDFEGAGIETMTITLTVPKTMGLFYNEDGKRKDLKVDLSEAHDSWLIYLFTNGYRVISDDAGKVKGPVEKRNFFAGIKRDIESGTAKKFNVPSVAALIDPVQAETLRLAKNALGKFLQDNNFGKTHADFAANPTTAKYFKNGAWNDGEVIIWCGKMKASGKADYRALAEKAVAEREAFAAGETAKELLAML